MQAEATFLERVTHTYVAHRGLRLLYVLALPGAGLLLFLLAGGFPPRAWVLLIQVLPQTSALLAARGPAVGLALIGLILISVSILLAWGMLIWLAWRMLAYWWYERGELQRFAADMEETQYLSAGEESAYTASLQEEDEVRRVGNGYFMPRKTASPSALMRRRVYPLEPLRQPDDWDNDEEDGEEIRPDTYQDEDGSINLDDYQEEREYTRADGYEKEEEYAGENGYQDEDAEMGNYQEGDEDFWESEEETIASLPAPSRHAARQPGIAAYDPGLIAHSDAPAQANPVRFSSYGRFISSAPAATLQTAPVPRLNTFFYGNGNVSTTPMAAVTPIPAASPATIQLIVSTGLDVGLKRKGKPNEDSLLALQNTRILRGGTVPIGLFVIADGMGGHENGQEASRMVIQSLSKTVVPSVIYGPTDDNYAELLAEGVHHANLALYQRNREARADMGTTIAAALIVNTTAYVVNVGDSRVYLYRATSGLSQVTRDHSTVARLVETGLISPEDVYTHPRRNEIYRSLGRHPSEDIDRFTLALQPDDLLVLCSDGLWEMVRDSEIQRVIESTLDRPMQISTTLVQAALDGGGKDNVSVIVVCVRLPEESSAGSCAD